MRGRMTAVVAVLVGIVAGTLALAAPAVAQDDVLIVGTLIDESKSEDEQAIEGVEIVVTTPDGREVARGVSDAEGHFEIPVPYNRADPSTHRYIATLSTETLPDDVTLRDPQRVRSTVNLIGLFENTVQFPLGPDTRDVKSTADQAWDALVNGIVFGVVMALAALGLSMIFGTTGLTNFAHGELVTFGAIVAYGFNVGWGYPVILAGALAVVLSGGFGFAQDRYFWRPLRDRGTGLVAMMIVTIGMAIFLRYLYQYVFGGDTLPYSEYVTPEGKQFGPINVTVRDLVIVAVSVVILLVVTLAIQTTRMGKATRAVSDNPALAASSGINVNRVISLVWIGATALAGLSGFLLGLSQQVDFQMGLRVLLLMFAAVTLGGLGTVWGALVGSLIVGVLIEMSTVWIPADLKYLGALGLLIVMLLIRPQGLLGRRERIG